MYHYSTMPKWKTRIKQKTLSSIQCKTIQFLTTVQCQSENQGSRKKTLSSIQYKTIQCITMVQCQSENVSLHYNKIMQFIWKRKTIPQYPSCLACIENNDLQ